MFSIRSHFYAYLENIIGKHLFQGLCLINVRLTCWVVNSVMLSCSLFETIDSFVVMVYISRILCLFFDIKKITSLVF